VNDDTSDSDLRWPAAAWRFCVSGRFPVTTVASELEGREKDGWAVVATQTFREIRIGFVGRHKRSHLGLELVAWSASALVAELSAAK